jgi:hypothetical protein
MTSLTARLADILDQHEATLRGVDQAGTVDAGQRRGHRVLLPADQQRGCAPPRITSAHDDISQRKSAT